MVVVECRHAHSSAHKKISVPSLTLLSVRRTRKHMRFLFLVLLFLLSFASPVSPLQDELSALATAEEVNNGSWVPHRGHGETQWLTWLPNSFKQDGSDLYLFEAKDLCRCSKRGDKGKHLMILLIKLCPSEFFSCVNNIYRYGA